MVFGAETCLSNPLLSRPPCDGGLRKDEASCGWVIYANFSVKKVGNERVLDESAWELIAFGSVYLGQQTSGYAELHAQMLVANVCCWLASTGKVQIDGWGWAPSTTQLLKELGLMESL